ncbi:ribosomal protein S18-alanine N-acetyltransferase [uncultured Ilyobacter sp.]|uniref:ribosomal protein S18-alanine N-acetyltransferase n=1 Tax=uncultured Ilyobacter sp. TaxID=544433 RepID=UPI0029F4FADD|nr:ribosomal protein S18-alanine N-acetyltransferase [uncultured Ilyobacter sp.]
MEVIQGMNIDDIEGLYQLEKKYFPGNSYSRDSLFKMLGNSRYYFWEVWKKEKLIGYAILLDSIDIFEIIKIAVDISYRNQGIGEELLRTISQDVEKSIHLEVRESNLAAIKLYEKMGFENLFKRKNYYGDTGEDALVMVLNKQ